MLLECENCGREVRRSPSQVRGKVYCSRACYAASLVVEIECVCESCGRRFLRKPGLVRGKTYCSLKCAGEGKRGVPWADPERRREVARLYRAGHTMTQLAQRFNVASSTILADLRAMGVAERHYGGRLVPAIRLLRIGKLYKAGSTIAQIARAEKLWPSQVWNHLVALGVTRRPAGASRRHPDPGPRACTMCGEPLTVPAWRAARPRKYGLYCSLSCASRHRWKTGHVDRTQLWTGRARQRWLGRWKGGLGGAEAGKHGRARGYTDKQAAEVLELRRRNPKLGGRELARRTELTYKQIRGLLARV